MTARAFAHQIHFAIIDCAKCRVPFGIPQNWQDSLRNTGADFYCPAGHANVYRVSELDRTRKLLEEANRKATKLTDNLTYLRERNSELSKDVRHERNRVNGYRGVITKTKKRIAGGACTCCNRTFSNLHRHMANQHPTYATVEPADAQ